MVESNNVRRVAIACQGGGSHTAFTAGALKTLLKEKNAGGHDHEIVALSGTSGGAICALLAWYGLLMDDADKAVELLDSFWRDNSANSFWDRLLNNWFLQTNRFFANVGGTPAVSPYFYPSWGQDQLRSMLEKHVDFGRLEELVEPSSPVLLVSAVDVLSGKFKAFHSRRDEIIVEMILASAAIPTLFKAVHIHGGAYWDGLFSQNPPIRELCGSNPNEIWVIQINPETTKSEPKTVPNILDRRNQLSGNLSLNQEIFFIEKVNEWIEEGYFPGAESKIIKVRRIPMLLELDRESKLNRDPTFVQRMIAHGEEQAEEFLQQLAGDTPLGEGSTGRRGTG